MSTPDIYTHLLRSLNASGIRYMVTGGVAAIVYGEPRLTNDVDVVMALDPRDAGRLAAAFPLPAYYAPPVEVIVEEAGRPTFGHFNLLHIDTALRADIYVAGTDPLAAWGLAHRRPITIADDEVPVAPIEYVILQKLISYRDGAADRHRRDIAAMIRLSGNLIDYHIVADWVDRLSLGREWASVTNNQEELPREPTDPGA